MQTHHFQYESFFSDSSGDVRQALAQLELTPSKLSAMDAAIAALEAYMQNWEQTYVIRFTRNVTLHHPTVVRDAWKMGNSCHATVDLSMTDRPMKTKNDATTATTDDTLLFSDFFSRAIATVRRYCENTTRFNKVQAIEEHYKYMTEVYLPSFNTQMIEQHKMNAINDYSSPLQTAVWRHADIGVLREPPPKKKKKKKKKKTAKKK
jgi:hypothetical protein